KFADNKGAVAYGNLQLAQQLQSNGDAVGALAAAEKAYAAMPNNMEIITTAVGAAQQAKNWSKAAQYANAGGRAYNGIGKTKPEGMSDAEAAAQAEQQRKNLAAQYEFLEAASYNAIASEQDPKSRFAAIEQFTEAFPKSKYAEPTTQLAIVSLAQINDMTRLAAFSEKALAANPNSLATLAIVANAFSQEQSGAHLAKATEYAKRAIELSKTQADANGVMVGLAHSALGYTMLRQDGLTAPRPGPKTPGAIAELKLASAALKSDPGSYAIALYWLGFACAKSNRMDEARSALSEAAGIPGPYQALARDLLGKVNSARAPRAAAK